MDTQSEYLLSSLEQAHDLPEEVDSMVRAWQRGDTQWFADQMRSELGRDARLYDSVLVRAQPQVGAPDRSAARMKTRITW